MRKNSAGRPKRSRCGGARDATREAYSLYVERGATEPTKQMGLFQRPARALRVMGVDPGLVDTGFGVLEAGPGAVTVVDAGVISTSASQSPEARLNATYGALHRLIQAREPGLLVVEDLYPENKF